MRGIGLQGIGIGVAGVWMSGGSAAFVGPYDAIPSITAAYGMRRLLTSYTGNLLRLRRASDNAESDFGYVAATGALDTAAIATFLTATTGFVTTWYDQAGSSNATQITAANQPQYSASGYLTFDGSNDYLDTGIIVGTSRTYSMVARFSNVSLTVTGGLFQAQISSGDFARTGIRLDYQTTNKLSYAQGGVLVVASAETAAAVAGIAGVKGYLNGVDEGITTSSGASNISIAIFLGAENFGGSPSNMMNGRIHEFIASTSTYNSTQMAAINTIMAAA